MSETATLRLVLISGLSGSGKSIALRALEDAGYNCVDNLPVSLLAQTVHLLRDGGYRRLAVAMDARGGESLASLPGFAQTLRAEGVEVTTIFLDARDQTLLRRFAETRRRHPLEHGDRTIEECLKEERTILAPIAEIGHHIDTSEMRPARFDGRTVQCPVYQRERLDVGATFEGPAIIDQLDCTTVVFPNQHVHIDNHKNMIITTGDNSGQY